MFGIWCTHTFSSCCTDKLLHTHSAQRDTVRQPRALINKRKHDGGHIQTRYSTSILTHTGTHTGDVLHVGPQQVERLPPTSANRSLSSILSAHLISSVCPRVCLPASSSDFFQPVSLCLNLSLLLSVCLLQPLHRVSVWRKKMVLVFNCVRQLT